MAVMQKVLTAAEMREVDRLTIEKYGIPSIILMENAAHAAARVIAEKLGGSVAGKSFLILCGKGNNGGDGAALARVLAVQNARCFVYLLGSIGDSKGDAQINFKILESIENEKRRLGYATLGFENQLGLIENHLDTLEIAWNNLRRDSFDVIVDAVFGTGLTHKIEGSIEQVVKDLSSWNVFEIERAKNLCLKKEYFFVSLDIPSGLSADISPITGTNFHADLTVTFTAPKLANVLPPASRFNGELVTVNIGSPQELIDNSPSQLFVAERRDAQDWLRQTRFEKGSYKNKRGHALLVVGSKNYTGAAVMSGDAAVKTGVGLVTVATPESAKDAVAGRLLPEVITNAVAETETGAMSEAAFAQIEKLFAKIDALAIGCGLDASGEETKNLVKKAIENRQIPVVIDADGLNALAPFDLQGSDELPLILTPHEGEMRRLLGVEKDFDFSDRVKIARDFSQKHHVILLLKGERSLVAAPDGRVVVNPTGNEGLGKGGSGDTLTGIIVGFIAQSFAAPKDLSFYTPAENTKPWQINAAFDAVIAALYLAGMAGDIAAKKIGMRSMTASDVRECLVDAFRELENE